MALTGFELAQELQLHVYVMETCSTADFIVITEPVEPKWQCSDATKMQTLGYPFFI